MKLAASLHHLPGDGWGEGVPSPEEKGEGHGSGEEPGGAAVKDSSAYGARNVRIVAAGTGEALPGPTDCVNRLERGDL